MDPVPLHVGVDCCVDALSPRLFQGAEPGDQLLEPRVATKVEAAVARTATSTISTVFPFMGPPKMSGLGPSRIV